MKSFFPHLILLALIAFGSTVALGGNAGDRLNSPVSVGQGQSTSLKVLFDEGRGASNASVIVSASGAAMQFTNDGGHLVSLPTITDTLVTLTGSGTLTNKTMDGGSNTFTNLPTSSIATGTGSQVLRVPDAGGSPAFGAINLSSGAAVTSQLKVANGGTGDSSFTTNAVVVGASASPLAVVTNNSSGTNEFLTQSSSNAPAWAAIVAGDVPNLDASKTTTGSFNASRIPTNMNASTFAGSTTQYSPAVGVRATTNAIEFGNGNTSGYGSTIGSQSGNGQPFICFSCGQDGGTNTYKTTGNKGTVILGDLNGGLAIQQIATANSTGLTPSNQSLVTSSSQVGLGGAAVSANGNVTVNVNASLALSDHVGIYTSQGSSQTCTAACQAAAGSNGYGTNQGICLGAWSTGGGSNQTCAASGSFYCLCAGGR